MRLPRPHYGEDEDVRQTYGQQSYGESSYGEDYQRRGEYGEESQQPSYGERYQQESSGGNEYGKQECTGGYEQQAHGSSEYDRQEYGGQQGYGQDYSEQSFALEYEQSRRYPDGDAYGQGGDSGYGPPEGGYGNDEYGGRRW